jgi:GT2 family glycosyltransferase
MSGTHPPATGAQVTVVIPNWNGGDRLKSLLKQLGQQSYPISQVIVVDNGSIDGSAEAAEYLGADIVRLGVNRGFAAAVNAGVAESQTELIAIINNDVELDREWLGHLVRAASGEDVWFATGKIMQAVQRDTIDGAFDAVNRGACAWRCGSGRPDSDAWNQPRVVQLASLTAALMRASLFRNLGPLDERFESYLEDVDFGLRGASRGYTGRYVPEAVAYHFGSATLGTWHPRTVRQIARNQVFLVAKHYPTVTIWKNGWAIAVAQGLWGLLALRHGAGWAFVRGKIEGCRRFKEFRRSGNASVSKLLIQSEEEIRQLQFQTGFDWYWRMYFALT